MTSKSPKSEAPAGKAPEIGLLISTCPPAAAEELAAKLVESRRAACVNIVDRVRSVYRWKGEIEKDDESLLIIKCPRGREEEVRDALIEAHPYDVPEVLILPVSGGNAAYLEWVVRECGGDG